MHSLFCLRINQQGVGDLCMTVPRADALTMPTLSPGQTDSQVDAGQRTFSTCVKFGLTLASTCVHLLWLWFRSNLHARFSPFCCPCNLYVRAILGHPSQVLTQVQVLQTCVDLALTPQLKEIQKVDWGTRKGTCQ